MTEELVIREIRIDQARGRAFRFTDDEFLGHHATETSINYKSPIVKCGGLSLLVIRENK